MTTSAFTASTPCTLYSKVLRNLFALACFVLLVCSMAYAQTTIYKFETPEQEKLFHELTAQLRCPQCQNNNIAESNAGLSSDMRDKVYELVQEGQSKDEIVQYMVERYGNFITYDPPVTAETIILWLAPLISLLIGLIYIVIRSRKSAVYLAHEQDSTEANNSENAGTENTTKEKQQGQEKASTSYAFIGIAVVFTIVCTSGLFYATTDWAQLDFEKKAIDAVPELKARYEQGNITNVMQVQQLALGLRSQLLKNPNNPQDWRLLAGIYDDYMMRPDDALRAIEFAYRYDPDDIEIKSFYGQMLLRSSFNEVNREKALELLHSVLAKDPNHLSSLYWLALYAQSAQKYSESIPLWERLLAIIPSSSPDAKRIREHLERDKQAYEQLQANG